MNSFQTTAQDQLANLSQQYQQLANLANQQQKLGAAEPDYQLLTVDGVEGARAFRMGRNSKAALFDLNDPIFFFKATDANGNELPLKMFEFREKDIPKSESDFVTVKDLEAFKDDLRRMLAEIPVSVSVGAEPEKEVST